MSFIRTYTQVWSWFYVWGNFKWYSSRNVRSLSFIGTHCSNGSLIINIILNTTSIKIENTICNIAALCLLWDDITSAKRSFTGDKSLQFNKMYVNLSAMYPIILVEQKSIFSDDSIAELFHMNDLALQGDVSGEKVNNAELLHMNDVALQEDVSSEKVNHAELFHMHDLVLQRGVSSKKVNHAKLSDRHNLALQGEVSSENVNHAGLSHMHDLAIQGEFKSAVKMLTMQNSFILMIWPFKGMSAVKG